MRAPRCPQAWAWLVLVGLVFVATYQQTGVDTARPSNNRQEAKLHFVCKEGDDCLVWPLGNVPNGINETNCGVVLVKPSALQRAQMKYLRSACKSIGFYCKKISILGANKKKRLKRQSSPRRGKFRGQTQSQYLNIGGHDHGKAEALSDADSSRALVSGKSGMGQAQSQSVYDPNCDECIGHGSYTGAENIRHNSGPRIAISNDGRLPTPGYSSVPEDLDNGRSIHPTNVNLQRPGTGLLSNNGNNGLPTGQNLLGTGDPYQPPRSTLQPGGTNLPGNKNYEVPGQGSFNTGISSLNGQPDRLGGSQSPTQQQETGFVNRPKNIPGLSMQNPIYGQIPNSRPMDVYEPVPNNGLSNTNGQIPYSGPTNTNRQMPNNGQIDRNEKIPHNGPIDRNGQMPNNGPMDMNGQLPYNGQVDRNGLMPNNRAKDNNGRIPYNGQIDRNIQMPYNNGLMDSNGQIPYKVLNDRNPQTPNNGPMDRNGPIPNNGPVDRTSPQTVQNISNGSSRPSPSQWSGFDQTPALYPTQYPPTSYDGNLGPSIYPGQMNSQPISTGNGGNLSPLENKQHPHTSLFPGQTIPTQGSLQIQDRKTLPIPYGSSSTSFIGPNGETYVCCIVAPNQNTQEFGYNLTPTTGQLQPQVQTQLGTQGHTNYPIPRLPDLNNQYDTKGSQGIQNGLAGQGTVGLNYPNNQPGSTYGIRGQGANIPSLGSGSQSTPYGGGQTVPYGGSGSQGNPYNTGGRQNIYPSNAGMGNNPQGSFYNGNQGTPYYTTGQNPITQAVGRDTQGPSFNYALNGGKQSPYDLRGQEQSGAQVPSYFNSGQVPMTYPMSNQNTPYDSQRQDKITPLGSPYYNNKQSQNTPSIGREGQNLASDLSSRDQINIPIAGGNGGPLYFNQAPTVPPFSVNGQETPYSTNGEPNNVPANNSQFTNNPDQGQSAPTLGQDVKGTQGYPYEEVNGVSPQGATYSPGDQIQPSQSSTGGTSLGRPWNNIQFTKNPRQGQSATTLGQDVIGTQGYPYGEVNGVSPHGATYTPGTQIQPSQSSTGGTVLDRSWNTGGPFGTGSINLGPGQAQGQTGSRQGGQGQTYPNTIGAQYPQLGQQGSVGQAPTQQDGRNGEHGQIPSGQNNQNPSPGSYIIGNKGDETAPHGTGGLPFPDGHNQPVGSNFVPGNQPVVPAGNSNSLYPGAQTTGLSNEQGSYNTIKGPNKDVAGPGFTQTSLNGMPQNEFDPNAITSEKDESLAQASITQDFNGTMAIASSKGGNEKGKANTQVQGSYTGTGSFSAQAQITDEDKGAESQVSGGKEGATSNALGKGKNNKSQANVQLGSETGSLQTQSQSGSKHHSTNSQVQGGVKGGMADAQARGPGSTSSQAQIGFTPYKDGDKAHDILKTPFVGVGSASAQSNGNTGQSQSQLQGTFKYGISYNGAAQSGASIDKDAVFENRMPYKKVDVFEGEKNINIDSEIPLPVPKLDIDNNEPINNDNHELDHPHAVHHKTNEQLKNTTAISNTRSFDSNVNNDKEKDYEFDPNRDESSLDDYDGDGANPPEYYDEFPREQDSGGQHVNTASRRNIDVQQTTRGNTQRIVLGNMQGQNADIVQKSSEQEPDYRRVYQPGERVPGTGGYIIPAGFTGSIQAISSRDRTIALGSRESPSQAQTVSLTPGNGQINYITTQPAQYGKSVNPNQLKSLNNNKSDENRYMTVSKSVSGALDEDNKIKKEYSHTYYTKSSSCGYFTFTCTMVRGTNGTKKVCKPKVPTNPDGTPIKC